MKIKTESLPKRCEVCHQADRFDPLTGYCDRCACVSLHVRRPRFWTTKRLLLGGISLTSLLAAMLLLSAIYPEILLGHFPSSLSQWLWPELANTANRVSNGILLEMLKTQFIRKCGIIALVWTLVFDILLINFLLETCGISFGEPQVVCDK